MPIYRLENTIQNYAWGSTTAIAELSGNPAPANEPQAELWMGVHPKGPSEAVTENERIPLAELIRRHPARILGKDAAERFDNQLPFLFKVLAAAQPLSIQAHPDKSQAREGFARENRENKPRDAPDRNYRDGNHKPEIICALTPFWGLNGFRAPGEIVRLLEPVCPQDLQVAFRKLKTSGNKGLEAFFEAMMGLPKEERPALCEEIVANAESVKHPSTEYDWIQKLAKTYPEDLGILSPALLNLVCLKPGQAMYLPAGQLHAYLDGVGIELMANSDNVLRGGLTPKHVDLPELLRVVRFEPTAVKVLEPISLRPGEAGYTCPTEEFVLSVIQAFEDSPYLSAAQRSVEILLCTAGEGTITSENQGKIPVTRGDSLLIPAGIKAYTLRGNLTLYKAAVPPIQ
jgi:mannose-6-phosphate isomerase